MIYVRVYISMYLGCGYDLCKSIYISMYLGCGHDLCKSRYIPWNRAPLYYQGDKACKYFFFDHSIF